MTTNSFNPPQGFFVNNSGTGTSVGSGFTVTSTSDQAKPRAIFIEPKANGYTLGIGCQTFVFESLDNMIYRIHEYYSDPLKVESHFESTNKLPTILSKKDKKLN